MSPCNIYDLVCEIVDPNFMACLKQALTDKSFQFLIE